MNKSLFKPNKKRARARINATEIVLFRTLCSEFRFLFPVIIMYRLSVMRSQICRHLTDLHFVLWFLPMRKLKAIHQPPFINLIRTERSTSRPIYKRNSQRPELEMLGRRGEGKMENCLGVNGIKLSCYIMTGFGRK